jgi:excisionase family DNA binding protein
MTRAQVAAMAGTANSTVSRAIARGVLPAKEFLPGVIAVRREDAERWANGGRAPKGRPRKSRGAVAAGAPPLLTRAEVAELAGVARSTVSRAIRRGDLPAKTSEGGGVLVRREDAERWANGAEKRN